MSEQDIKVKPARELAPGYFRNPRDSFWRWVEKGKIVEWRSGDTLCYREELARVLRGLTESGLPPLASVLLLLAACADSWSEPNDNISVIKHSWQQLPVESDDPSEAALEWQTQHVLQFLGVVSALPANLRTGEPKLHLFREVFSAQAPQISAEMASALLDEWNSGLSDSVLHFSRSAVTRRVFSNELTCLAQSLNRFPTTEALALHLRTGLDKLPEPLPAPVLPEPTSVAPESADLLDQLARDPRTAGLARLTQQLVAALRIPLHARGASDQPIGGVSDVTNRGNLDRLLLSELAHDDDVLLARLVNNEALYMRREAPPRPDVKPRTVLLDTTLRMWGVPRVFGLAAALAWARNSRQSQQPVPVAAFALGGQFATPLNLDTFDGVVAALGQLDPAPHAGPALLEFGRTLPAAGDCLLITDAQLLHQAAFARQLAEAAPALRFLLTVERSGELQLYEYQNGHRTLASTARYDLEALLFTAAPRQPLLFRTPTDGPAFLQQVPAPLYYPVTGLRVSINNTFYAAKVGVLSITDRQRVLFWPSKDTGARELLPEIESGAYHFGSDGFGTVYVLVSARQLLRIYAFITATGEVEMVDLTAEVAPLKDALPVVFKDGCYHVQCAEGTLVFDCRRWEIRDRRSSIFPAQTASAFRPNFSHVKRHINSGFNVLHRVNYLGVLNRNALVIEGHALLLVSNPSTLTHELQLMSKNISTVSDEVLRHVIQVDPKGFPLLANEQLLFRRFAWPDGSGGLLDPRGLLHLRSADATVPEITLVLVLGQPTAAWAADGAVCGSPYFTGPNPARHLSVLEFDRQYLQRFIAHLG
ncbi:hypothetical protein [Hymenobacter yonginensis]|uniref:Uncharacterized protein n=1 Tax=Hymenobacter yonginensis TaxID=748197 RepID=A0ABY7PVJ2_9BACT|nr:hypothetical protein [Hymenobacter yonginensis]WBO86874.1 hypothetical protein O9Z63_20545 [Hymenobacter yonginensis]